MRASRSPLSFGAEGFTSSETLRSTEKYPSGALRASRFHRSSTRRRAACRRLAGENLFEMAPSERVLTLEEKAAGGFETHADQVGVCGFWRT